MGIEPGGFDLSMDELRVVARYAVESVSQGFSRS
jgi:hypothetical protein